jgi:hypothetical protein
VLDDQDDFDGGGAHVSLDDRGVLEPLFIVMSLCLCNVPWWPCRCVSYRIHYGL